MAPRKKKAAAEDAAPKVHGVIEGAGEIQEQQITDTLEQNYMPYAMSVILSRAIPEIDGFKPSHRKLLYSMYKMGLLGNNRTKSTNIVGVTMRLNPHGEGAIYDTMVRLSRGYEALLHPYVDSKGNFGKAYSRDMAWAASRYTEARLDSFCQELFRDIDKDTVDFVDNYDNTMKEPTLLPTTFPAVLVNANTGIAVGMASSICSFNLKEICETTIELIRDPEHDIMSTLLAPDFPGGGLLIYDRDQMESIYNTGRGSFKVRSRYTYDKSANCIDITQIPPSTTVEVIVEKVVDLVKQGKIKEISDIRDETGLQGLRITIDLKRGTDPDKLMKKLFRMTTLEDSFSCNFNILIADIPKVLGVREILDEWTAFRTECVRRRTYFDLSKKRDKLHLLEGLEKILLDIDKAIAIIRKTDEEAKVVPNLMEGFQIDEIQAEYVAEIKLRHLNREYLIKRTEEIESLIREIQNLEAVLKSRTKVRNIIIRELEAVIRDYGRPRKTMLLYADEVETDDGQEEIPDYPVHLYFTAEGYFKKMTQQAYRMSGEHKLKEGDRVIQEMESNNRADLLFFTDQATVYKAKGSDFADGKSSVMGDYIPAKLSMQDGEQAICLVETEKYDGFLLFCYENGKVSKVELSAYATKTNRKKLIGAYSDKSPVAAILYFREEGEAVLNASSGHQLLFRTKDLTAKASRNTQGVIVMKLRKNQRVTGGRVYTEGMLKDPSRYRKKIPALGSIPTVEEQMGEQITFDV